MPRYRKVLAVVDLSADSDQVLLTARDLAEASHAALVAMHVVEFIPIEPLGESLLPNMQIEVELVKRAREKFTELAARLGLGGATLRVEAGPIKSEILRVAEEEAADLIVVGSRERHGLAILVNFTEDAVLHAAHCDVLAVRLR
jgi:universal stress protein A